MRRHDPWWLSFDPGNSPSPDARHPSMPAPGHHWCWRHLRLPNPAGGTIFRFTLRAATGEDFSDAV